MRKFLDRAEAGRVLAGGLAAYRNRQDVIVLALPRGGVPVGYEIAQALNAPLDVFLVRKLGYPGHEEFAIGAIASGGVRVMNPSVQMNFSEDQILQIAAREERELNRREHIFRGSEPMPDLHHRTIILVDDGLATGSTMRAAVLALRQREPAKIIVAVPVASGDACELLSREADQVICASVPEPFSSVGQWYQNFDQTSDEEVQQLLRKAREHAAGRGRSPEPFYEHN